MDFKNMSKSTIALLIAAGVIVIWAISAYNGLVKKDEAVIKAWANVETDYQRRADLIPNLVEVVKGYASHESETFKEVVEARSKATAVQVNIEDVTEENMKKFQEYQKAQGDVTNALGKLLAITEAYPELKANENFKELQAQLEGTENRIKESRKAYNDAVNTYNVSVRKFPTTILASIFGFDRKVPFQAAEGADKAPDLKGAFDK
jgi:LemA protein